MYGFQYCSNGFRRAEQSFFAQGHVEKIPFFPLRDIPLRFNFLSQIFPASNGRAHPIFV